MFDEIDGELAALGELREKPAGTIRITAGEHSAKAILWPALAKLLPNYADIKLAHHRLWPDRHRRGALRRRQRLGFGRRPMNIDPLRDAVRPGPKLEGNNRLPGLFLGPVAAQRIGHFEPAQILARPLPVMPNSAPRRLIGVFQTRA